METNNKKSTKVILFAVFFSIHLLDNFSFCQKNLCYVYDLYYTLPFRVCKTFEKYYSDDYIFDNLSEHYKFSLDIVRYKPWVKKHKIKSIIFTYEQDPTIPQESWDTIEYKEIYDFYKNGLLKSITTIRPDYKYDSLDYNYIPVNLVTKIITCVYECVYESDKLIFFGDSLGIFYEYDKNDRIYVICYAVKSRGKKDQEKSGSDINTSFDLRDTILKLKYDSKGRIIHIASFLDGIVNGDMDYSYKEGAIVKYKHDSTLFKIEYKLDKSKRVTRVTHYDGIVVSRWQTFSYYWGLICIYDRIPGNIESITHFHYNNGLLQNYLRIFNHSVLSKIYVSCEYNTNGLLQNFYRCSANTCEKYKYTYSFW